MSRRPLIGITTSLVEEAGHAAQRLDGNYVDAVETAGGAPVILPMTDESQAAAPLLEVLDGLLITGGPGITQGLVGRLPDDLPPVPARRFQADRWAFEAMRRRRRPVLGICYGMQFLNACLGGGIYGDVQDQLGTAPHAPSRHGGAEVVHDVDVVPGSRLAAIAAGRLPVNSHHLQAVARLASGLRVNARSPDGVVEGFESDDGLLMGVQFHPERLPGTAWAGLFADLVRRAAL